MGVTLAETKRGRCWPIGDFHFHQTEALWEEGIAKFTLSIFVFCCNSVGFWVAAVSGRLLNCRLHSALFYHCFRVHCIRQLRIFIIWSDILKAILRDIIAACTYRTCWHWSAIDYVSRCSICTVVMGTTYSAERSHYRLQHLLEHKSIAECQFTLNVIFYWILVRFVAWILRWAKHIWVRLWPERKDVTSTLTKWHLLLILNVTWWGAWTSTQNEGCKKYGETNSSHKYCFSLPI